jgi:hypothetical protein
MDYTRQPFYEKFFGGGREHLRVKRLPDEITVGLSVIMTGRLSA